MYETHKTNASDAEKRRKKLLLQFIPLFYVIRCSITIRSCVRNLSARTMFSLESCDLQIGFKKSEGCSTAVFCVQQVINYFVNNQRVCCCITWSCKAFYPHSYEYFFILSFV